METPTRVFDFLHYQMASTPQEVCLGNKSNGNWKKYSTEEVIGIVNQLSLGFIKLGLKLGDKVAIISANRPEWNFIDQACTEIGIVTVPVYPTITVDDYNYIFEHAEVKVVFVQGEDLAIKAKAASEGLPIQSIYSFDELEHTTHWKEILSLNTEGDLFAIQSIKDEIKPEDLFTIIYTSGTTGRPKGVMLSHANIVSNVMAVKVALKDLLKSDSVALSFLPLCHILERTALYYYFFTGVSVYYAESMETIGENIKELRPNMFTAVPRLLEKIYDKIISKGYELPWLKRKLFFWAVDLGLKYKPFEKQGAWYGAQLKLARKLIFSKWKEALGNNLSYVLVGAAALQPRLGRIFLAAEIPVCEGYGLTETSPGIAFNVPVKGEIRIGAVKILDKVEVKIAEDGEILCKGPNVMMGYYKGEEQTKEVIVDGWFHTGDIGVKEEEGFIRITDRKKEMFKTSGGKYIAPQLMENRFKESMFIEQVMVLGEGQKFPSALIVPNFEALTEWCRKNEIEDVKHESLITNSRVIGLFESEVAGLNTDFGNWEQIKKFEIVEQVWGIDTGELTPSLKLKRRVIKQKFAELIDSIYGISS